MSKNRSAIDKGKIAIFRRQVRNSGRHREMKWRAQMLLGPADVGSAYVSPPYFVRLRKGLEVAYHSPGTAAEIQNTRSVGEGKDRCVDKLEHSHDTAIDT